MCQNCGERVDDDLIFCTNCGVRLVVPTAQRTVSLNDSVVTKAGNAKPPKNSSPLKWIALIIALIAIPVSIFGVYLLMNRPNYSQVSQTQPNSAKSNSPVSTPTRKAETNQNNSNSENANESSANESSADENSNENASAPKKKTEVMNERIEIAPKSSYAKSFTIEGDTKTLLGKVELLQGETYKGFVYLQSQYDEHFPDELYKMFIFGEEKKSEVKSALVPENYVLVFVNETDKPLVIRGNFWLE